MKDFELSTYPTKNIKILSNCRDDKISPYYHDETLVSLFHVYDKFIWFSLFYIIYSHFIKANFLFHVENAKNNKHIIKKIN